MTARVRHRCGARNDVSDPMRSLGTNLGGAAPISAGYRANPSLASRPPELADLRPTVPQHNAAQARRAGRLRSERPKTLKVSLSLTAIVVDRIWVSRMAYRFRSGDADIRDR